ncbi:hypothetical protein LOTGIDRAFT_169343 [Lottia gigantea]|uniref:C-type lectin domain-containing protein n=1 Tax=Lottia gigantea TaxID=225164 RepID=V3ZQZ5_LOTGI|nr:hypothetical protein LOTGIDRAFT_169343 [Lottia gigantea]ESO83321.1 hypothetical protein LOTGIDRAFT_169343 [Lottia gigantea]
MKFEIVIFMVVFPGYLQAESNFVYRSNYKRFNEAVEDCNNRGLELLTLSTYRQYLDAQENFDTSSVTSQSDGCCLDILYVHLRKPSFEWGALVAHEINEDSWLALEWNSTIGNYQWLNGRVLTELRWGTGEPSNYTVADCGVMNVSSRLWYTLPCTDSRYYLCVGSDRSTTSVDFYTAVLNCQSEGRRLPVAITNLDTNWLNDNTESMTHDIWLGLIEYDDYYRWVTGEHLTPPYHWKDSYRYIRVHYHYSGSDSRYFHCYDTQTRQYVCQPKPTDPAVVVRSSDKFVFVSNNAMVLGFIRKTTTINSLRRFQCALECLQDTGCIQYTIQGYLCRTFGESLVITDYSRGHMLWQKKVIS